jgi:hypothetical protein
VRVVVGAYVQCQRFWSRHPDPLKRKPRQK